MMVPQTSVMAIEMERRDRFRKSLEHIRLTDGQDLGEGEVLRAE